MDIELTEREQQLTDFALSLYAENPHRDLKLQTIALLKCAIDKDLNLWRLFRVDGMEDLISFCNDYVKAGAFGISGHLEYVTIYKLYVQFIEAVKKA